MKNNSCNEFIQFTPGRTINYLDFNSHTRAKEDEMKKMLLLYNIVYYVILQI